MHKSLIVFQLLTAFTSAPLLAILLLAAVKFSQMDNEELEFENRKNKIEAFKKEFKALMDKYNFGTYESDQYNGMDEYCGSVFYFVVDGERWYGQTVGEILDEIVGNH